MNETIETKPANKISKEDSKAFFTELSKMPENIQNYVYLELESPPRSIQEFDAAYSQLNQQYNIDNFVKRPRIDEGILRDVLLLVSHDSLNYHQIKFLLKEIKETSDQNYQHSSQLLSSILDFLEIIRRKNLFHCPIQVDTTKILTDFKTQCLVNAKKLIENNVFFHRKNQLSPEKPKLFSMIVSKMAPEYFDRSAIYPVHYIQNIFDATISQPTFLFYNEIQSLIVQFDTLPPNHFMNILIETRERIRDFFENLKNIKNSRSILFILLVRFVFDRIYPNNHHYSIKYDSNYLITIARTNFSKLGCDLSYFKDDIKPLHMVRKTLTNDPFYSRSIQLFETIQFHTNPIDILGTTYRSIEEAANAANHYQKLNTGQSTNPIDKKSEVFSRIFAAVILASNVPELKILLDFVDNYITDDSISDILYESKLIFKKSADFVLNIVKK